MPSTWRSLRSAACTATSAARSWRSSRWWWPRPRWSSAWRSSSRSTGAGRAPAWTTSRCCGGRRVLDRVWLIPLLPLAGAVVNLFLGPRLGRAAGWLATGLVGLGFVLAVATLLDLLGLPTDQRVHVADLFDWISV